MKLSAQERLKKVFYTTRTTTKDAKVLAKRADTSTKTAREFLKKQKAVQVTRRYIKPKNITDYAPTGAERGEYEGDVIYFKDYAGLNKGKSAIFTILETNSRYVYARALTKANALKLKEAMMEILVQNTEDVLKGVEDISKGVIAPILKLRLDGGGEFKAGFKKLCKAEGVVIEITTPGTHEQLARVDRFHRSLREMIGAKFKKDDTHEWFDELDDIIYNYNHRQNRGLSAVGNVSPSQIGPAEEEILRQADLERAAILRKKIDKLNIKPGDQVRLLRARLEGRDAYKKSEEHTFTSKVYTIKRRYGPNSFLVDVPGSKVDVWPVYTLQFVKDVEHFPTKKKGKKPRKIDRKQVSRMRQLDREISKDEREANVAAVRGKRRAKKIDYAKLARGDSSSPWG